MRGLLALVDLAEDYNAWKLGLGIIRNTGMEEEDTHAVAIGCRYIFVRFDDEHTGQRLLRGENETEWSELKKLAMRWAK